MLDGQLAGWERELSIMKERVVDVLGRRELKETCSAFLDGLLAGIERKTCGLRVEQTGAKRPLSFRGFAGSPSAGDYVIPPRSAFIDQLHIAMASLEAAP